MNGMLSSVMEVFTRARSSSPAPGAAPVATRIPRIEEIAADPMAGSLARIEAIRGPVLASRGRPITIEALADMAGCCRDTGQRALNVLFDLRIVTYRGSAPAARRAGAYRINWDRVFAAVPPPALETIKQASPPPIAAR